MKLLVMIAIYPVDDFMCRRRVTVSVHQRTDAEGNVVRRPAGPLLVRWTGGDDVG